MYDFIIKKLKINSRMLFFVALIIFVFFSFTLKQKDEKKNIVDLLDFLDRSFNRIDTTFNDLSNQSIVLENVEKNYDKIINQMQSLSNDIGVYKLSIPNQTGNESYQKVRVSLVELYAISQEKADLTISIYKSRKNLISYINNYYKIKNPDSIDSNQDLQSAILAWKNVIEFKKIESKQNENKDIRNYLDEKIKKEEDTIQNVANISANSGETINPETKVQLVEALKSVQVARYDGFLRLQVESLESPVFGERLKSLQENVKELKRDRSLTS
jgi:hypothetical protein